MLTPNIRTPLFILVAVMSVHQMQRASAQPWQQPLLTLVESSGEAYWPPARNVADNALSRPGPAQTERLKEIAASVNRQRTDLFQKKDAAGLAKVYTVNANYIELLPHLVIMQGREQIEDHFRELFNAKATALESTITTADMIDSDTIVVGGDYFIQAGMKKIAGHFIQIIKQDHGAWKIANHIFARPEPISSSEFPEHAS